MIETARIGFVGAGGNAQGHMQRVAALEGARITAICDLASDRAEAAAAKYQATAYTDYRRLLGEEDLDALYVSVPPFAHYDAEILAAERGVHLFVEKPVALTLERGLEVWEAIARAGIISCAGYQVRYAAFSENVREFVADKNLLMVNGRRWGSLVGGQWWQKMELSGGQLVEQATHQIDLIRYWAGEVRRVYATYARRVHGKVPGITIPDLQAVQMEFANGAIGHFISSCTGAPGGSGTELFLEGMKLTVEGSGPPKLEPANAASLDTEPREVLAIDQVFVEAVRSGDRSRIKSPYLDALKTLDVTLAANLSAKQGQPVETHFGW
ncbi:MAG: Gfo/Idh/MocA family oxidoreductase [Armatimonadetes bacterium]|nr:Gfo/Idh/MocA family oxidoreductase [Armatimonadota bacterium]